MTAHETALAASKRLEQMTAFQPNGWFREQQPDPEAFADEFAEDCRVVVVDGVAGYRSCPDCVADERLSDDDLLTIEHSGETGTSCNLCKDTGKVWVSL